MSRKPTVLLATCCAAVLGACEEIEPEARPPVEEVLTDVPVLPKSILMSRTGTAETAQLEVFVALPVDSAANLYRSLLIAGGWSIQGDMTAPDGRITIHAQRDGPPLWAMFRDVRTSMLAGTLYTLIGAAADSSISAEVGDTLEVPEAR